MRENECNWPCMWRRTGDRMAATTSTTSTREYFPHTHGHSATPITKSTNLASNVYNRKFPVRCTSQTATHDLIHHKRRTRSCPRQYLL